MDEARIEAFIAEYEQDDDDEETEIFEFWPDTADAIRVFRHVYRFVDRAGISGLPVGLNPMAVEMMLRKLGLADDLQLFEDLMTIGDGQAAALREQINRD